MKANSQSDSSEDSLRPEWIAESSYLSMDSLKLIVGNEAQEWLFVELENFLLLISQFQDAIHDDDLTTQEIRNIVMAIGI